MSRTELADNASYRAMAESEPHLADLLLNLGEGGAHTVISSPFSFGFGDNENTWKIRLYAMKKHTDFSKSPGRVAASSLWT